MSLNEHPIVAIQNPFDRNTDNIPQLSIMISNICITYIKKRCNNKNV